MSKTWKLLPGLMVGLGLAAGLLTARAGDGPDPQETYRAKRAEVASDDAGALCRLGAWCRENGLSLEARGCFEEALAADPENLLARRALGYEKVDGVWLRDDALRKARGFVRLDGRWVLREEVIAYQAAQREKLLADERLRAGMDRAAHLVRALGSPTEETRTLARKELASLAPDVALRPLIAALNSSGPESMRQGAVEVLATFDAEQALRPLVRASITDASPAVRQAAVSAVRAIGQPAVLAPYVTALGSTSPAVRQNAVAAIGDLGYLQGVQVLVRHWEQHGGGSPRAHILFGNQLAFIQDFDVEVAQTAFIADPQVGTLQEGSVLETQVLGGERYFTTVERQLIRRSLQKLAGEDLGDDVKAWVSWADRHAGLGSGAPADLKPTGDLR